MGIVLVIASEQSIEFCTKNKVNAFGLINVKCDDVTGFTELSAV